MTTDIQTIQGFASSSTLDILVDMFTIVAMLALMFWLNWDFTLIALAVTGFPKPRTSPIGGPEDRSGSGARTVGVRKLPYTTVLIPRNDDADSVCGNEE
jgi:ABC-type multidrug transport system fused ATPase/permease subunit